MFGGPVKVLYDVSRELVKRGHEVVVYTSDVKNVNSRVSGDFAEIDGVKICYFKNLSMFFARRKIFITPSIIPTVRKNIKFFDIVHIHGYRSFQNPVLHYYLEKKLVPYVLQSHGTLSVMGISKHPKRVYDLFIGRRILRDAASVIALTRMEAEQYRSIGVPEEKISVIPNGIDLSEFTDLPPKGSFRKKFGIDDDEKIVLYLGRIHKIKGIDVLVKAFANVVEKLEDVKLVVVGPDDGYLGELRALIRSQKIEGNVLVTGPLYGKGKLEAYIDADVYVLPSRYEIFGMTILEACACAKPVVATKVSGAALDIILNGHTGFLVQPEKVPELTEALIHLLTNEDKAKKMGMQAKERAAKMFSIETVVDKIENLYKEILR